jgi:hypothetical protein
MMILALRSFSATFRVGVVLLAGCLLPPFPARAAVPAPFFTPIAADPPGLRGFLARAGRQGESAATADARVTALRERLARYEEAGDPAELKAAITQWEAVVGAAVSTVSGRPGVRADALRPRTQDGREILRGQDWQDVNARLLRLTGESRFGDVLEASLYAAADPERTSPQPPTPNTQRPSSDVLLRFRVGDTDGLALNLFETSTATLKLDGKDVTVHVLSRFPREGRAQLIFRMPQPARFAVWIRVPAWASELRVRSLAANTEWVGLPGDWARLPARAWEGSDWLEIRFPLKARPTSLTAERRRAEWEWGPMLLSSTPERDASLAARLDPGTEVTDTLDEYRFPRPVSRPSRPARPEGPPPPGKPVFPTQERRGWYTWLKWDPDTWRATVGSDPPGQTWKVRVLPWAGTIRHMVYGTRPDDLLPGERVNIFLGAGEDGEWSYLNSFQDELMQMRGHGHWWYVRSVAKGGRKFTARLFTPGDNLLLLPEETFEVDPRCESWRDGKTVKRYPLRAGERVRMISVYRGERRAAMLLTDDTSLDAIRERKLKAERERVASEGMAGFVDSVDGGAARLTLFSTSWPYGHELKPGQSVRITATGPGFRPSGVPIEATVLSAKVGGQYGSGDTAVEVQGPVEGLRPLLGGKVVRLIPGKLPEK